MSKLDRSRHTDAEPEAEKDRRADVGERESEVQCLLQWTRCLINLCDFLFARYGTKSSIIGASMNSNLSAYIAHR